VLGDSARGLRTEPSAFMTGAHGPPGRFAAGLFGVEPLAASWPKYKAQYLISAAQGATIQE
jgi:hypothetical protein